MQVEGIIVYTMYFIHLETIGTVHPEWLDPVGSTNKNFILVLN